MDRTIPIEFMHKTKGIVFGKYLLNPNKELGWDPDKMKTNSNVVIWGTSGSGKSRILKEMIKSLALAKKTVHVIDPHNDLKVEDPAISENYMEFTARNSPYGINPFEYDRDRANGGPKAQAALMLELFKKAIPNITWGPKQVSLLLSLVRDTYRLKGISDDDENTWGLEIADKTEFGKILPTLDDMQELLGYIRETVATGFGAEFATAVKSLGAFLSKMKTELDSHQKILGTLNSKRTAELQELIWAKKNIENIANSEEEKKEKLEQADKEIEIYLQSNTDSQKLEESINAIKREIKALRSKIFERQEKLHEYFRQFINYTYMQGQRPEYMTLTDEDKYSFLDLSFYGSKEAQKILETLNIYTTLLSESGIFNKSLPPIQGGCINRYNIKGLSDQAKIFFVGVLTEKINRILALRGEYHKLEENLASNYIFLKRFPNTKFDTAIVLDEAQSIFPANVKDRENPEYSINKGVAEVRKFGGFYIFASQRPQNFSGIVLSNSALKIGLKTDGKDEIAAQTLMGIKDKSLFPQIKRFGTAAITDKNGDFRVILLPWADLDGLS